MTLAVNGKRLDHSALHAAIFFLTLFFTSYTGKQSAYRHKNNENNRTLQIVHLFRLSRLDYQSSSPVTTTDSQHWITKLVHQSQVQTVKIG